MIEREEVEYFAGGSRIVGWLFAGAGAGRRPAVVFCPGFTGTKFAGFYQPYVEELVAAGWSVLLSDYRGWGESDGPWGEIVPQRQVADVRAGIAFLRTRADIDPRAISLFGVSFGGGVAVAAAGSEPQVRCCIVISPVSDGSRWLKEMRREYEWQEFLGTIEADRLQRVLGGPAKMLPAGDGIMIPTPEKRATTIKADVPPQMIPAETPLWCAGEIIEFRPADDAARLHESTALLVFCVTRDGTVPAAHGRSIHAAARGTKRLVTIDDDSHYGTYVRHFRAIIDASLEWLALHGASNIGDSVLIDVPMQTTDRKDNS